MDEENNLMEETALMEDSSDVVEFSCGDPKVEPRVGDEFQAEIPPMLSASERAVFLSTPLALDDSLYSFLVGQPVQVTWIDKHPKGQANGGDDDVDMNQSLQSLRAKRSRCSAKIRNESDKNPKSKKQRLNLEAVPELPSSSWEDHEVASFVLGLYTFGKNFTQIKKFMESKGTGEILLFYFGKFYNSARYHTWCDSRKKRSRKCVYGRKLYSGWRQQLLLSRLVPFVSDESQIQMLVNVSKSFAEGKITLGKYINALKDLVGLRLLVDAVAIGKGKEDLTVRTSVPPVKTKQWFTVSPKSSSVPGLGPAYTSLTSADIINQLNGSSRLSKARCSDIFWEAVWPRLLARGWHSEKPKDKSYFTSKDNIVFIVPGVKRFSRGELVKGDHYFDSVSDILAKVASEPELLEFETGGVTVVPENSSDQSDEESSSPSGSKKRHRYLKSPCSSSRGSLQMKFTVVDTSLATGGKLCDLRNLKAEYIVSEPKTGLGDKDSSLSSQNVEMSQVDAPMRFVIVDTSLDHRKKWSGLRRWKRLPSNGTNNDDSSIKEEKTLERVKDPSKWKHRADTNHHSVKSASSLKRRRLSACIKREKSLSKEDPESDQLSLCAVQQQNSTREEMNEDKERYETELLVDYMNSKSDQSEKTGTGPSSEVVETQEIVSESKPNGLSSNSGVDNNCFPEEVRTSHELISSEQDSKRACSVSGSEERRVSNDPEQEQAVELPSITGADINSSLSKDLGSTQDSSELQQHDQQANADAPRRHSTRKRPLTTRALEALESGFLTTETMESTVKPRKRDRSSKKKHSAKVNNRAQPDNGIADMEQRREDGSKATASNNRLDQIEDTKPTFILNGATTESKPLDQRHDSKPVVTEHRKLPPIILKLSLKRSRAASET